LWEQEYESKHEISSLREKRLQDARKNAVAVFLDTNRKVYFFYWLIVNTRRGFYLRPGEEPPEGQNDAMVLPSQFS
jgi:hypothetical protein